MGLMNMINSSIVAFFLLSLCLSDSLYFRLLWLRHLLENEVAYFPELC
jgi:hypothetical protein